MRKNVPGGAVYVYFHVTCARGIDKFPFCIYNSSTPYFKGGINCEKEDFFVNTYRHYVVLFGIVFLSIYLA